MPSWSDIIGGDVSFTEKVTDAWDSILDGSDGSDESEPSDDETTDSPSDRADEWWYGNPPPLKWPKPEPIRMAPMQPSAETIEVNIYHQGTLEAAKVMAAYAEFALRDAFGDRYHVDVSVVDEPIDVDTTDEFFEWVDANDGVAKDANLLVADGTGWHLFGGGKKAVTEDADAIAELYGETLFVDGGTEGHTLVSTGLHEILHCLGFDHRDGGKIGSAITPMGHYGNSGSTYSARLHPNVRKMTPDVK